MTSNMIKKTYIGVREANECVVQVVHVIDDQQTNMYILKPRTDLRNHSPDGFGWGYGGSAPAQLALAMLADFADDETALQYYQQFKADFVAPLQGNLWVMESIDIEAWLDGQNWIKRDA